MAVERPLTQTEQQLFSPYFKAHTLKIVRIIEGYVPFWLFQRMSGVVVGHRIYLRVPLKPLHADLLYSAANIELLAHELTHVEQYLSGMTILKYLWASRCGYQNNPYEIEAYAKGAMVRAAYL
ncbi:MAG: hypothetical protein HOP21_12185 [Methylotenera sp.]|nr:hypothetical protein [Methylotenera sp.]